MATQKFKKYYELMTNQNEELFNKFEKIHSAYVIDEQANKEKFHKVGLDVVDTIRFWERKLCSGMERGNNAVYSDKLADKFWGVVRTRFSHIDMVGLKSK